MSTNRNDPFDNTGSPFGGTRKAPAKKNPPKLAPFTPVETPNQEAPTQVPAPVQPVAKGTFPQPALPKPEFKPARGSNNTLFPTEQAPYVPPVFEEPIVQEPEVEEYEESYFEDLSQFTDAELDLAQKLEDSDLVPAALPTLFSLAEDDDWVVRAKIAANSSSPASLLERLSKDPESLVRQVVMTNPNTSDNVYRYFAFDADDDVIYSWVKHSRTTPEMLKPLYETNNLFVASALIDSFAVPAHVKAQLKQKHKI